MKKLFLIYLVFIVVDSFSQDNTPNLAQTENLTPEEIVKRGGSVHLTDNRAPKKITIPESTQKRIDANNKQIANLQNPEWIKSRLPYWKGITTIPIRH